VPNPAYGLNITDCLGDASTVCSRLLPGKSRKAGLKLGEMKKEGREKQKNKEEKEKKKRKKAAKFSCLPRSHTVAG
jgi:hypothetical protein